MNLYLIQKNNYIKYNNKNQSLNLGGDINNNIKKQLIISMNHSMDPAGFFVYLEFVINGILYCINNNQYIDIPKVIFDEYEYCRKRLNNRGYNSQDNFLSKIKNPYFDSKYGNNMWDYFFYIKKETNEKSELYNPFFLNNENCTEYTNKHNKCNCGRDFWSILHYGNNNIPNVKTYPRGAEFELTKLYNTSYTDDIHVWYYKNRILANKIINEYIGIKEFVLDQVNDQWNKFFNKNDYVIGIHVRGTDKVWGGKKVEPNDYIPYIDKIMSKNTNVKIFLATDDPDYINPIVNKYGDIVKYTDAQRDKENIFLLDKGSNYHKGLDVLTDCLLLSKCNFIIKSNSAVSEFAIYFNLELHDNSLNLQYDCSNFI
jgi:hypothetical protein